MFKRSRWFGPMLVLPSILFSSCGPGAVPSLTTPAAAEEIRSTRPRSRAQVSAADLGTLTSGNTTFALDLYHALGQEDGNLFFSPHSISLALAMTYAGAASTTAEQMRNTLHFTLPGEQVHAAFNALDAELTSPRSGAQGPAEDGQFTLRQANALWGQHGYTFRPAFLDLLAEQYGGGLNVLDFAAAPEPSRERINAWVEEQTEQKITDLLPPQSITSDTRLVLANAIYFKAKWVAPFDPSVTREGPFTREDGSAVTTPLMHQPGTYWYNANTDYQAVRLDYHGDMAMVVLLPAEGQFDTFEAALTPERLSRIVTDMREEMVALTLPKLDYTSPGFQLKPVLESLGMTAAFSPVQADFSGFDGTRDLFIGNVYHKAMVLVDEEGTEAAAATGVTAMATSARLEPPIEMRVDRPFIFLIRDNRTGAVLFVGRIVDPRE